MLQFVVFDYNLCIYRGYGEDHKPIYLLKSNIVSCIKATNIITLSMFEFDFSLC